MRRVNVADDLLSGKLTLFASQFNQRGIVAMANSGPDTNKCVSLSSHGAAVSSVEHSITGGC